MVSIHRAPDQANRTTGWALHVPWKTEVGEQRMLCLSSVWAAYPITNRMMAAKSGDLSWRMTQFTSSIGDECTYRR